MSASDFSTPGPGIQYDLISFRSALAWPRLPSITHLACKPLPDSLALATTGGLHGPGSGAHPPPAAVRYHGIRLLPALSGRSCRDSRGGPAAGSAGLRHPGGAGAVAFNAALGYAMSSSYHWIEIQDDVIRGRKLLTRRLVERPIAEVVRVIPLNSAALRPIANAVMNAARKTSNRGYELRFRDGLKMGLVRGDMAGLDAFMEVLQERLGERWAEVAA